MKRRWPSSALPGDAVRGRAPRTAGGEDRKVRSRMTFDHDAPLRTADPAVAGLIDQELRRQQHGLELIASENFASRAVLEAMGTALTNKYAEGYPGKRYYGGCEIVDQVEQLAIDRAMQLFGAGPRQRAAPRGGPGQLRRVHGAAAARRPAHGHVAAARRAPLPRHLGQPQRDGLARPPTTASIPATGRIDYDVGPGAGPARSGPA